MVQLFVYQSSEVIYTFLNDNYITVPGQWYWNLFKKLKIIMTFLEIYETFYILDSEWSEKCINDVFFFCHFSNRNFGVKNLFNNS